MVENNHLVRALVGDKPVALVTSAGHMPRALDLARRAGLNVAAFPVDFRALRGIRPWWDNWIFSTDTLALSGVALREVAALTFRSTIGTCRGHDDPLLLPRRDAKLPADRSVGRQQSHLENVRPIAVQLMGNGAATVLSADLQADPQTVASV